MMLSDLQYSIHPKVLELSLVCQLLNVPFVKVIPIWLKLPKSSS